MRYDEIISVEKGKEFIRNRITELRIRENVSEYQMSFDLGQSKSYIQSISSGRAMPSMSGFLNICDYFKISPLEFFDSGIKDTDLLNQVIREIKDLSEDDLKLILKIVNRIKKIE